MKKSINKSLLGLAIMFILTLAITSTASASISYSSKETAYKELSYFMKASGNESSVRFAFKNLKTGNVVRKKTSYTTFRMRLGYETWYKVRLDGYNYNGKKVSSKTFYTCNNPTRFIKLSTPASGGSVGSINVKWPAIYGSTGYKLYYSTDGKTFKVLSTQRGTSYTLRNVPDYKRYYFKVRPYKTIDGKTYVGPTTTRSVSGYLYTVYH